MTARAGRCRTALSPDHVLDWLLGSWELRRSADNGVTMDGTAVFHDCRDGLAYHERGRLQLVDGQSLDAERRYLFWRQEGGFAVLFAEAAPRLFHHVLLRRDGAALVGGGIHHCGADRYDSLYRFPDDGTFSICHAVCGPNKRYTMTTLYTQSLSRSAAA